MIPQDARANFIPYAGCRHPARCSSIFSPYAGCLHWSGQPINYQKTPAGNYNINNFRTTVGNTR